MHSEKTTSELETSVASTDYWYRHLIFANTCLLVILILHDLDHFRQTIKFCFSLSSRAWIILVLGCLPGLFAILLSKARARFAPHLTIASGLAMLAVLGWAHLIGGVPFTERYVLPYKALGVDGLSWFMLWALAFACIYGVVIGFLSIWKMKEST